MKTLFVGLCVLCVTAQATAAANGDSTRSTEGTRVPAAGCTAAVRSGATTLERRLEQKLAVARRCRSAVRFFTARPRLLQSPEHARFARTALWRAQTRLARVRRDIAAIRAVLERRQARRLARTSPRHAICDVFGRRYCGQALAVAWCESRHSTTARNGQYLGLFQMGSSERRLFGHGRTARQQALAAHRYFVVSGRDWSPWSCKPSFAV